MPWSLNTPTPSVTTPILAARTLPVERITILPTQWEAKPIPTAQIGAVTRSTAQATNLGTAFTKVAASWPIFSHQ